MSGVSVEMGPASASSQADADLRVAYAGGDDFFGRLQALSTAKAEADRSLAALKLGTAAASAFTAAKNALAEADKKHAKAAELCSSAEGVLRRDQEDAASAIEKAKVEAAAIVAAAQETLDDAAAVKASHDAALAAAIADRKALADERAAAARLGEEAEKTRQSFEAQFAKLETAIKMLLEARKVIVDYADGLEEVSAALDRRAAALDRAAAILGGGMTVQ